MIRFAFALALAAPLAACATVPPMAAELPDAAPYAEGRDAMADVDAALARAKEHGTRVLLVMGGNWCHDSRALAGWLETPRLAALVAERYEPVYVHVAYPNGGERTNIAVARRFGIDELPGTPNVFVITPEGRLVNPETVTGWRNASSRSEEAIYTELAALADR
ncbi:thioredoxin family protein [Qipengyuania sp. RANM35]|uniref:thioredoxin family protein n=1 Tax=Qipengyuania sp. RANM35 TaxID=3068635 RepID=UPI0034DB243B